MLFRRSSLNVAQESCIDDYWCTSYYNKQRPASFNPHLKHVVVMRTKAIGLIKYTCNKSIYLGSWSLLQYQAEAEAMVWFRITDIIQSLFFLAQYFIGTLVWIRLLWKLALLPFFLKHSMSFLKTPYLTLQLN